MNKSVGNGHHFERRYVLHISPEALQNDPELLSLVKNAGISEVAISGYLYGHWFFKPEVTAHWMHEARKLGMEASIVNAPLGHPGDSMGSSSGTIPLTPPKHWKQQVDITGERYTGNSIHEPALAENAEAVERLIGLNPRVMWMDDDLRLARTPGIIGGCFCSVHKQHFLQQHGYNENAWDELADAVKQRRLCKVLENWVDWQCDQVTAFFKAQQKAAGKTAVGMMVMRLGCEKAGIRLSDYTDVPFRVGEEHFNDPTFGPVKGKTEELYSALFHRRYAKPELAYSETTAYPVTLLSASNMAAKLAVGTICDVRNTMFQSGMSAFPRTHWQTLAPAMKHQAAIHAKVAGASLKGPLKHYFGKYSRYVGLDDPYTLFLAMGIPFEVCDKTPHDGWVFTATPDVPLAKELSSHGAAVICRPEAVKDAICRGVVENLGELMKLKQEIIAKMGNVPYVQQDLPVVCAWYPQIHKVVLWNLTETHQELTVVYSGNRRTVGVNALDTVLLDDIG